MNRLMNCDQVFEILTRAPFPSGEASDASVEHHLGSCHACRELAEALRPAVDLFHESIPADESLDLPGYMGRLFAAVDESATATVTRRPPATRRSVKSGMASAGFGTAICLLVCGGLVLSFGRDLVSSRPGPLAASGDLADRPVREGRELLASLNLPLVCRTTFEPNRAGRRGNETIERTKAAGPATGTPSADRHAHRTRCCTECHAVANPDRPKLVSTVKLSRSCAACHRVDNVPDGRQALLGRSAFPALDSWLAGLAVHNNGSITSPWISVNRSSRPRWGYVSSS